MPRPPRADEAGGFYHTLNRGNLRAEIFHKDADNEAFARILHKGLQLHQVQLFSYQLMPNHYHLVLRPGHFLDCQTGLSESMNRFPKPRWMRYACVLSEEAPWAMQVG